MDAKDIALIKALGGGGSGGSITVDSALSNTSENPVQNKVIKSALEAIYLNTNMKFSVTGQRIELTEPVMLVAGTVRIYTAAFSFDSAWDGYTKTAVFCVGDVERERLLTDDACTVPWEVLVAGKHLRVGVYGTKDDIRLPTIWTERTQYINAGAGPTDEAAEPSPTLVEQLTAKVGNLDALKTEDKSSLVAAINEVKETGGGGGTADHSKLKNRDAADQHPMSAIIGLEKALEGKQAAGNYITEESDPTVPAWAKQTQKPAYTAQEVGALPATTHIPSTAADVNAEPSGAVSQHNVSDAAHSDIRLLIQGLSERLSAVADSDDTTLDQLSEIVEYIKSNRDLISAITTDKVSVADIVDNLTTNVANKPLSAAQGVALKALIDAITIPEALPNPNALTFTGAVTGSYDGSEPLTVNIQSSGGGSDGSDALTSGYTLIMAETLEESSAINITDDGTYNELLIFIICPSGKAISFSKFTGVLGWGNRLNNVQIALASGNKKGFWGHIFRVQRGNDKSVVAGEYATPTLTNTTTNVFNSATNIQILDPITSDAEMSGVLFSSSVALPAGSVIHILGR